MAIITLANPQERRLLEEDGRRPASSFGLGPFQRRRIMTESGRVDVVLADQEPDEYVAVLRDHTSIHAEILGGGFDPMELATHAQAFADAGSLAESERARAGFPPRPSRLPHLVSAAVLRFLTSHRQGEFAYLADLAANRGKAAYDTAVSELDDDTLRIVIEAMEENRDDPSIVRDHVEAMVRIATDAREALRDDT